MIRVCDKDIRIDGRVVRIARLDGEKYTYPDDPEKLLAGLRGCRERVDILTFLQKLPETKPQFPYKFEWDNLAVLQVSSFDHWWSKQVDNKTRNMARKAAKKGVVLREVLFGETLLRGICSIYNETPVRQGKRFPHYGMTMEGARDYAGTFLDRSIFIGAFCEDQMIGFIKLTMDKSRTMACLVHILSMHQHREKAPTNALIAQAVRTCAERSIPYLVYEHFYYGKKQGDGLSHFKEVNGFQCVALPRYYIPLTGIGQVAFRLGLHRRLADNLPESITNRLRDFRKMWYDRKIQPETEA